MLLYKPLPLSIWAEAVNYSCFIQNRIHGKVDPVTTPETLFYGQVPNLSKVQEFGIIAFIHVPH
jgi:hypothetical protein